MRPATTPAGHPPRAAQHTAGAMPDTQSLLEEVAALYPMVAYWNVEEPGDDLVVEGRLDEDTLDEVIFAGMVALR